MDDLDDQKALFLTDFKDRLPWRSLSSANDLTDLSGLCLCSEAILRPNSFSASSKTFGTLNSFLKAPNELKMFPKTTVVENSVAKVT